jgi:hypothetical protein
MSIRTIGHVMNGCDARKADPIVEQAHSMMSGQSVSAA